MKKEKYKSFLGKKRNSSNNLDANKNNIIDGENKLIVYENLEKVINKKNIETINLIEPQSLSQSHLEKQKIEDKKKNLNSLNTLKKFSENEDCLILLSDGEEENYHFTKILTSPDEKNYTLPKRQSEKTSEPELEFEPEVEHECGAVLECVSEPVCVSVLESAREFVHGPIGEPVGESKHEAEEKLKNNLRKSYKFSIDYKDSCLLKPRSKKIVDDSEEFDNCLNVTPKIMNHTIVNINTATNNYCDKLQNEISESVKQNKFQPLIDDLNLTICSMNSLNEIKNANMKEDKNVNLETQLNPLKLSDSHILLDKTNYSDCNQTEKSLFIFKDEFAQKLNVNHPITEDDFINLILANLESDITANKTKIFLLYKDKFYNDLGLGFVENEENLKNFLTKNKEKFVKPVEHKIEEASSSNKISINTNIDKGEVGNSLSDSKTDSNFTTISYTNTNNRNIISNSIKNAKNISTANSISSYSLTPKKSNPITNKNFVKNNSNSTTGNPSQVPVQTGNINNTNSLGPLAEIFKSSKEDKSALKLKLYTLDVIKNRNYFRKSDNLKFKKF